MKHFMTWWENEPTDFHLWTQYKLMKFAWRAALKWVLTKVETSNSDGSIIDYIKKELEERVMSIEPFKDIEKRCIGVVGIGGYYPLGSSILIKTNKVKNILIGTYIGPNYKSTIFTSKERLMLLVGVV